MEVPLVVCLKNEPQFVCIFLFSSLVSRAPMTSVACYMSLVQTVQCVLHRPQEEEEDNPPLTSNVVLVHYSPSSRVKMFEYACLWLALSVKVFFSGKLVEYVRTLCSAYNYIKYME